MADDLKDAEDQVHDHKGFENDEIGRLLAKVLRNQRLIANAVKDLRDRVDILEAP